MEWFELRILSTASGLKYRIQFWQINMSLAEGKNIFKCNAVTDNLL